MKKNLFFLVLLLIFFLFSSIVFSADSNCGGEGQQCCYRSKEEILNSISIKEVENIFGEEKQCLINIDVFDIHWICIDKIIKQTYNVQRSTIVDDETLENLSKIGVCKEGLMPSTFDPEAIIEEGKCTCLKNFVGVEDAYLCYRYFGKNKQEKEKYLKGEINNCISCVANQGYYSAIGCIYFKNLKDFITKNVFRLILGLGGIIAFFCIIYSALQLQLSEGNPEKIKKSQEMLTSCILGLVIIIFSVFLLKLIGVDVLKIPWLGR